MGKLEVSGNVPISRATLEAKIIRADGTVEDLGVIADTGPAPNRLTWLERFVAWLNQL